MTKQDGMQLALFAKPEWALMAKATIIELASTGQPFTADDVIEAIGLPSYGVNANNAVGAAVSAFARKREIVRVGFVQAKRAQSNGRIISLWQGLTR